MALCNDNFWSYTTEIIVKYRVRWTRLHAGWHSETAAAREGEGAEQTYSAHGGRTPEASLHEVRPFSITNSVSTSAASESPSIREGVRNKCEDLEITTKAEAIIEGDPTYFSQILPFVIPYIVPGPDYHPM